MEETEVMTPLNSSSKNVRCCFSGHEGIQSPLDSGLTDLIRLSRPFLPPPLSRNSIRLSVGFSSTSPLIQVCT
jgi:hypothetical protein